MWGVSKEVGRFKPLQNEPYKHFDRIKKKAPGGTGAFVPAVLL